MFDKLRMHRIDNVRIGMDSQHLIMNGDSLAECAGLPAEDALGHFQTDMNAGRRVRLSGRHCRAAPIPSRQRNAGTRRAARS